MQLTEAQRAFLDEVHYAVVGTLNHDGSIQQTVVWFLREGDELRFSLSASSVKVANLRRNSMITLTILDGQRYLTLSGRAVVEPADQDLRRRLAQRYLGAEKAEAWVQRSPNVERASVRITVQKAYGQGV
jgi:PPOX class probable F420-dependent enzyme